MAIGENDFLIDSMFASSCPSLDLRAELAQVKDILARAQKCGALQDAEPGWNEQVHSRVLELALNDQARVGFQNMYVLPLYSQRPPCDLPPDFHLVAAFDNKSNEEQYDRKNLSSRTQSQEHQWNSAGGKDGGLCHLSRSRSD